MSNPVTLHPVDTIQKYLVSTPSYFTGVFENNNLLIQHAFSDFGGYRSQLQFESTPVSRISFVIVFRTAPASREAGAPIPHYGHNAEAICSLLSVLFGKRFDLHGPLEHNGIYHVPEFAVHDQICNPESSVQFACST